VASPPAQPKTKWSGQEEAALITGVKKCVSQPLAETAHCRALVLVRTAAHSLRPRVARFGIGKWRLIQKDPELGEILRQRSNVDLKACSSSMQSLLSDAHPRARLQDKWRNMHPSASDGEGGGAVRAAPPAKPKASKDKSAARAASGGAAQAHPPAPDKRQYEKKLEDLVFEAVRTLKQAATLEGIAVHIEDKYDVPAEFRKQLAAHLKSLADAGKLMKSKTAFTLPGRGGPPKGGYDVKMAGYRNKPGGKVPEVRRLVCHHCAR